ncbi:MAG TPA: ABC transporter permease [Chthoniobacterales bacterium]
MPTLQQKPVSARVRNAPPGGMALLKRTLFSEYFTLVLCVTYFVVMLPFSPALGTPTVIKNIFSEMIPLLAVAIGQTFILILGEIDLSVTSTIALASVFGASIMTSNGGYLANQPAAVPVGLMAFLLVGLGVGFLNGASITYLGMPSFLVTLTTRMLFSGIAIWYTTFHTRLSSISGLPQSFLWIGQGEWNGIPYSMAGVALLAVVAHLAMTRTVFGRWLYAIGINRQTARVSGVPVERVVILAFMISGFCAALCSILYTGRLQTGTPILGERILLDVIGAVVIGGTSLFGGKGKVSWTVFGVLFLVLVDTTLRLLGSSLFTIFMVKGVVILMASVMDALRNRLFAER